MTVGRILSMAGEQVEFITTTEESGGARLVADVTMQPGAKGPMPHVHPIQRETFEILEGTARFRFGREKKDVAAGQTVVAEPGLPHGFGNPFGEPVKVRTTWTPASDLEHFFENLFGYASIGKTNSEGIPPLRQIALIIEAHPESGHPAMPKIIYKPIFKTLAMFGRWSGMSGSYPELCPHQPRR